MKRCSKCGLAKDEGQFVKNKVCKEGRAGTCRSCANSYQAAWKRGNRERCNLLRRQRYAETEGLEVKRREHRRQELHPLRVRCQCLRQGIITRARQKGLAIDRELFRVSYFIQRLSQTPFCECCGIPFDLAYKPDGKPKDSSPSVDRVIPDKGYIEGNVAIICWRCNRIKDDATAMELKTIAAFVESWGNETTKFSR